MKPNNYIVVQDNFRDGKLIRQQNGMYAVLKGDKLSEGHSTVRRLLAAVDKETSNGKQDTVQESTGDAKTTQATNRDGSPTNEAASTFVELAGTPTPKKSVKKATKR